MYQAVVAQQSDPAIPAGVFPTRVPANLTRSGRRERAVAWVACALLHVALIWLLNDGPPPNSIYVPERLAAVEPVPVWLPVVTPGEFAGRAIGPPMAARRQRPLEQAVPLIGAHGEVGRAPSGGPSGHTHNRTSGTTQGTAGGPARAAVDPFVAPDARAAESTPAPVASPDGPGAAEGAPIDWEAAKARVAREVARRYSNVDADGEAVGADGRATSGLMADGDGSSGRPDCGKIYSGAAIIGSGLWQYDGNPDQRCEWRR